MNAIVGWALAFVAIVAGWFAYRWQGVIFVGSGIAFWLLIQFSRALRAMKNAAGRPKGHVGSAVMLNAKLQAGMTLMQVIVITRSLGERVSESPEVWRWADEGHVAVQLTFEKGRLGLWELSRPEGDAA